MLFFLNPGNMHSFDLRMSEGDCFQIISFKEFELFQHLVIQGWIPDPNIWQSKWPGILLRSYNKLCVMSSSICMSMYKVNVLVNRCNTNVYLCRCSADKQLIRTDAILRLIITITVSVIALLLTNTSSSFLVWLRIVGYSYISCVLCFCSFSLCTVYVLYSITSQEREFQKVQTDLRGKQGHRQS